MNLIFYIKFYWYKINFKINTNSITETAKLNCNVHLYISTDFYMTYLEMYITCVKLIIVLNLFFDVIFGHIFKK